MPCNSFLASPSFGCPFGSSAVCCSTYPFCASLIYDCGMLPNRSPPYWSRIALRSSASANALRTSGSVIVVVLKFSTSVQPSRPAAVRLEMSEADSFAMSDGCSAPWVSSVSAVGSASESNCWLIVACAVDSVNVKVSGSAGRFGSVAGSQFGLRTSFRPRPRS